MLAVLYAILLITGLTLFVPPPRKIDINKPQKRKKTAVKWID